LQGLERLEERRLLSGGLVGIEQVLSPSPSLLAQAAIIGPVPSAAVVVTRPPDSQAGQEPASDNPATSSGTVEQPHATNQGVHADIQASAVLLPDLGVNVKATVDAGQPDGGAPSPGGDITASAGIALNPASNPGSGPAVGINAGATAGTLLDAQASVFVGDSGSTGGGGPTGGSGGGGNSGPGTGPLGGGNDPGTPGTSGGVTISAGGGGAVSIDAGTPLTPVGAGVQGDVTVTLGHPDTGTGGTGGSGPGTVPPTEGTTLGVQAAVQVGDSNGGGASSGKQPGPGTAGIEMAGAPNPTVGGSDPSREALALAVAARGGALQTAGDDIRTEVTVPVNRPPEDDTPVPDAIPNVGDPAPLPALGGSTKAKLDGSTDRGQAGWWGDVVAGALLANVTPELAGVLVDDPGRLFEPLQEDAVPLSEGADLLGGFMAFDPKVLQAGLRLFLDQLPLSGWQLSNMPLSAWLLAGAALAAAGEVVRRRWRASGTGLVTADEMQEAFRWFPDLGPTEEEP
jgi:hypothetical protein